MKIVLNLPTADLNVPICWVNFWSNNGGWEDDGKPLINALEKWGGKICWVDDLTMDAVTHIEFENEADATAFILRWS